MTFSNVFHDEYASNICFSSFDFVHSFAQTSETTATQKQETQRHEQMSETMSPQMWWILVHRRCGF